MIKDKGNIDKKPTPKAQGRSHSGSYNQPVIQKASRHTDLLKKLSPQDRFEALKKMNVGEREVAANNKQSILFDNSEPLKQTGKYDSKHLGVIGGSKIDKPLDSIPLTKKKKKAATAEEARIRAIEKRAHDDPSISFDELEDMRQDVLDEDDKQRGVGESSEEKHEEQVKRRKRHEKRLKRRKKYKRLMKKMDSMRNRILATIPEEERITFIDILDDAELELNTVKDYILSGARIWDGTIDSVLKSARSKILFLGKLLGGDKDEQDAFFKGYQDGLGTATLGEIKELAEEASSAKNYHRFRGLIHAARSRVMTRIHKHRGYIEKIRKGQKLDKDTKLYVDAASRTLKDYWKRVIKLRIKPEPSNKSSVTYKRYKKCLEAFKNILAWDEQSPKKVTMSNADLLDHIKARGASDYGEEIEVGSPSDVKNIFNILVRQLENKKIVVEGLYSSQEDLRQFVNDLPIEDLKYIIKYDFKDQKKGAKEAKKESKKAQVELKRLLKKIKEQIEQDIKMMLNEIWLSKEITMQPDMETLYPWGFILIGGVRVALSYEDLIWIEGRRTVPEMYTKNWLGRELAAKRSIILSKKAWRRIEKAAKEIGVNILIEVATGFGIKKAVEYAARGIDYVVDAIKAKRKLKKAKAARIASAKKAVKEEKLKEEEFNRNYEQEAIEARKERDRRFFKQEEAAKNEADELQGLGKKRPSMAASMKTPDGKTIESGASYKGLPKDFEGLKGASRTKAIYDEAAETVDSGLTPGHTSSGQSGKCAEAHLMAEYERKYGKLPPPKTQFHSKQIKSKNSPKKADHGIDRDACPYCTYVMNKLGYVSLSGKSRIFITRPKHLDVSY